MEPLFATTSNSQPAIALDPLITKEIEIKRSRGPLVVTPTTDEGQWNTVSEIAENKISTIFLEENTAVSLKMLDMHTLDLAISKVYTMKILAKSFKHVDRCFWPNYK